MELGIVTNFEVKENKDSTKKSILLQVKMDEESEVVRTVEFFSQAGEDTIPAIGSRVIIINVSDGYQIAIATTDDLESEVDQGEKEFYSTDSPATQKLARLKLNSNSEIELNGNADFAVAYNDLKTALENLDTAINAELTKISATLGAMVTAFSGLGITITPPYVQGTITTDITLSKVDKVKLP